jgi:hypothetical protein
MGRDDLVTGLKRGAHADGNRLFSYVAVNDAVNLAGVIIR